MKKFISLLITAVMILSVCCFTVFADANAYEITAVSYTDGNFKMLESMNAGDVIYIAPTIKKTDSSSVQPTVLIGVYNDAGLLCNTFIHRSLGMIEQQQWTCASEYVLPQNFDTYKVKTFVFADLASASPAAISVSKWLDAASNEPVPDNTAEADDVSFAAENIYDTKTRIDFNASGVIAVFPDINNSAYIKYDVELSKLYVNSLQVDVATFAEYANSSLAADIDLCDSKNGVYTTAYIWIYSDYIVADINPGSYKIYSDMGTIILNEDDPELSFTIYKDGKEAGFADISIGDVISVAGVKNSFNELESGIVIITSDTVSGVIEAYGDKYAKNYTVTVSGKTYRYDSNMLTIGSDAFDAATLGDQVTFYLNSRGIICGIVIPTTPDTPVIPDIPDISSTPGFFTVSRITMSQNSNGETIKILEGIMNGEEVSIETIDLDELAVYKIEYTSQPTYTASSHNNIRKGCVIQYTQSANGAVEEIDIFADINDIYANGKISANMLGKKTNWTKDGVEYTLMFGYVADKSGSSFYAYDRLGYKNGILIAEPYLTIYGVTGAVVDPYYGPNGKVYAGSAGDINWADIDETTNYPMGDIIFVAVTDDIIVRDFVAFRGDSY